MARVKRGVTAHKRHKRLLNAAEGRKGAKSRLIKPAREQGVTYGQFVHGLKKADIQIDRKILADLAVRDSATFGRIVELAKSA